MYFLEQTKGISNAKLYGFDDLDYADNIANYWERTHYNIDMNFMQLDSIHSGKHILTLENIESYFNKMLEKIRNYDVNF